MNPRDHAVWRAEKMGKATLYKSDHMMLGLNAFEPGQAHAAHAHADMDKAYYVLEGTGAFSLGEEVHELGPGQLLVAPAGVPHGVRNDTDARLLVLVTMAPGPR
jgi:quercetin dioxygenase-like cupin family protein